MHSCGQVPENAQDFDEFAELDLFSGIINRPFIYTFTSYQCVRFINFCQTSLYLTQLPSADSLFV